MDAESLWAENMRAQAISNTQTFQYAGAIRSDLNACAVLDRGFSFFEYGDFSPYAGEFKSRGKSADTAAADQNLYHSGIARSGGRFVIKLYYCTFWIAFVGGKLLVMHVQGGAVGAQNLIICAHVQEHMRVVVGRPGSHALEFLDADEDFLGAVVIGQMGYFARSHCTLLVGYYNGSTIAGLLVKW